MKKGLPKRLCLDLHTKYCIGKWGHRGCCACYEYNHGDKKFADQMVCQPYLLPGYYGEDELL